jgi:hypothetical protein
MKLQQHLRLGLVALAVFVITPHAVNAQQTTSNTCEALVRTAISQVGSNCAGLEQNEVCYGFESATVFNSAGTANPAFNAPAQRILLADVHIVQTTSIDLRDSTWGIAPISLQANLPVALESNGVVILPIGGVEIESAVELEELLVLPKVSISVVTAGQTELFSEPSGSEPAVDNVAPGTTLQVDGVSTDGQWLRTYFEHQREYSVRATAWVNISDLEAVDTDELPVISPDSKTPMQSFVFRNSSEPSPCLEAPPALLYVQGPNTIESDITVNGADIRISSSIALRMLPNNVMHLVVLSGITTVDPDTANPIIIPAGFMSEICVSDAGIIDRTVCDWSAPVPVTLAILDELRFLEDLPGNVLNYQLTLPGLICPSGVGNPVCEIIISDQQLLEILRTLCDQGILPDFICRFIREIETT